jgi:hypothetical protein
MIVPCDKDNSRVRYYEEDEDYRGGSYEKKQWLDDEDESVGGSGNTRTRSSTPRIGTGSGGKKDFPGLKKPPIKH